MSSSRTHAGRLLVATPSLTDPNFERTVVLLLDHDDDGALGVVLNRATSLGVDDVLEGWDELVGEPRVLFSGGPVEPRAVVALGLARLDVLVQDRAIAGRIRAVDVSADPVHDDVGVTTVRVFSGYAGWAPGQLEEELAEDAWVVVDPADEDVATTRPEGLWRAVLRRQQGILRAMSVFPDDPRLN